MFVSADLCVCVCAARRRHVQRRYARRYLKKMDVTERVALWLGCVTICLSSEAVYCCFLHNDPVWMDVSLAFPEALIRVSCPASAFHTHPHYPRVLAFFHVSHERQAHFLNEVCCDADVTQCLDAETSRGKYLHTLATT